MKTKTQIVCADSMEAAALTTTLSTWNETTQTLLKSTFNQVAASDKTKVFTAMWDEGTKYTSPNYISTYVQVYDEALGLYQVITQY